MGTVTVHEDKTHLSKLIARAEAGEDIVIARGKEPVATLTAFRKAKGRVAGAFEGVFEAPLDAFIFEPLPDDELAAREGRFEDPSR